MLPTRNVSVVVLCNFIPAPVRDIKFAALDYILGYEPHTAPIPASIPVCLEMENNGLDLAIALWDSLKTNHQEEYDFSPQHFGGLFMAMYLDRLEEAQSLTRLCVNIFPDNVKNAIKGQTENFITNNPDNNTAPAILEIILEE
jgi:hypothetical protein